MRLSFEKRKFELILSTGIGSDMRARARSLSCRTPEQVAKLRECLDKNVSDREAVKVLEAAGLSQELEEQEQRGQGMERDQLALRHAKELRGLV